MKLTQENLQFIDKYLQNSEVFYVDIRLEMLDHIAAAVEQKMEMDTLDFYDAFKAYMLDYKTILLSNNKRNVLDFRGFFTDGNLKKYVLSLFKPFTIIIGLFVLGIHFLAFKYWEDSFLIKGSLNYKLVLILVMTSYLWFYIGLFKKIRFYTLEKNIVFLFVITRLFEITGRFIDKSSIVFYIFTSIFILFFTTFLMFFYSEYQLFKSKNQQLLA